MGPPKVRPRKESKENLCEKGERTKLNLKKKRRKKEKKWELETNRATLVSRGQ